MAARVTQEAVEVAVSATPRRARVTQVVIEVPATLRAFGHTWVIWWP